MGPMDGPQRLKETLGRRRGSSAPSHRLRVGSAMTLGTVAVHSVLHL